MTNLQFTIFNLRKEMADNDILGMLQPYFDCELSVDDKDKILELHERFKDDVLIQKVNLDGAELKISLIPTIAHIRMGCQIGLTDYLKSSSMS